MTVAPIQALPTDTLITRRLCWSTKGTFQCAAIGQYPNAEHDPSEHDGFVIITADSAGGMVEIHDRLPVTLPPELARKWLDPATPKGRDILL